MSDVVLDVLSTVISEYGLPPDTHMISVVDEGVLSSNWIIGNMSNRWFLKRYRPFTPERVAEIHRVMRHFYDHGFPVLMPIASLGGREYLELGGAPLCSFSIHRQHPV